MVATAELLRTEIQPIAIEERALSDVDNLAEHRMNDDSDPSKVFYPDEILEDTLSNLKTAVQEGGIPHAVSTTYHKYEQMPDRTGVFKWMGKTAVENAMSGYKFHIDEAARARVGVEVDEAYHAEQDLTPGVMKVFISPRMSVNDADRETAKQEHLADDDAVRTSHLLTDEDGNIKERMLQSLLVRDIPLEAWNSMLEDPDNIFGESIELEDPSSALSVMKAHRELEVPLEDLPEGPVGVVKAVLPYINDPETYKKVEKQIELFESDQQELDVYAERIAERWLKFEVELEQSLHAGEATPQIKDFIDGLQQSIKGSQLDIIKDHSFGEEYTMTRKLAVMLEKFKKKTLWTSAAVVSGNQEVIGQIEPEVVETIRVNELSMQSSLGRGEQAAAVEAQNNSLIAGRRIKVGGGCAGEIEDLEDAEKDGKAQEKSWHGGRVKKGTCVNCHAGPKDVGVKNWCKDCISCGSK